MAPVLSLFCNVKRGELLTLGFHRHWPALFVPVYSLFWCGYKIAQQATDGMAWDPGQNLLKLAFYAQTVATQFVHKALLIGCLCSSELTSETMNCWKKVVGFNINLFLGLSLSFGGESGTDIISPGGTATSLLNDKKDEHRPK